MIRCDNKYDMQHIKPQQTLSSLIHFEGDQRFKGSLELRHFSVYESKVFLYWSMVFPGVGRLPCVFLIVPPVPAFWNVHSTGQLLPTQHHCIFFLHVCSVYWGMCSVCIFSVSTNDNFRNKSYNLLKVITPFAFENIWYHLLFENIYIYYTNDQLTSKDV